MDKYSTHLPYSIPCAIRCMMMSPEMPLLEFGVGFYSTPILKNISNIFKTKLMSFTSNSEWAQKFENVSLISWQDFDPPAASFVLLDNEQLVKDRIKWITRLDANVIVLHDANKAPNIRGLDPRYEVKIYEALFPHTAVFLKKNMSLDFPE